MKKRNVKKNMRGKNFIYDNFIQSGIYIKKCRIYFLIAIILILAAFLIGYFGVVGFFSSPFKQSIDSYITNSVEELVRQTENLTPVELTFFIITNNIKTAFFGIISGIFYAVSPIIIVIFNGYVLGFVAERAVNSSLNPSGIFILWRLFPHGIFEIPAILISIGLGIKLGLYPLYIKERSKGFFSLIIALLVFLILSSIIMGILSLFIAPDILLNESVINQEESFSAIMDNPFISFIFYLLIALSLIASLFLGLKVLSIKDRIVVMDIFKNSLRVFIFIIIPLLVIAGLIEGILIALAG